jgi:hypothetical protein
VFKTFVGAGDFKETPNCGVGLPGSKGWTNSHFEGEIGWRWPGICIG